MNESKPQELIITEKLYKDGKFSEAFTTLQDFEKKGNLTEIEQLSCNVLRSKIFNMLGDYKSAIEFAELAYQESQKLNRNIDALDALLAKANGLLMIGKLNRTFETLEQSKALIKTLDISKEVRYRMAYLAKVKGNFYYHRGNQKLALKNMELALSISEEIQDYISIVTCLNNLAHFQLIFGHLDLSLLYIERAITQYDKFKLDRKTLQLAFLYTTRIAILLDLGDLERARECIKVFELLSSSMDNELVTQLFKVDKALVLKNSLRARHRIESEDILKQVLQEETLLFENKLIAYINLCDLLIVELSITKDGSVLDELEPYITQMREFAEHEHSFYFLAESCLLQAKVSLITLDLKEARRLLIQGQQIAERHGYNKLSQKISSEHEKLLKKFDVWVNLKESKAPMAERIELAQIDVQIERMLKNRDKLSAKTHEEQVTVHKDTKICLVCKGVISGFTFICDCDVVYCQNCAQALTNLENACWVCNAPIDATKPVKPYEESKIGVSDKISEKKSKNAK